MTAFTFRTHALAGNDGELQIPLAERKRTAKRGRVIGLLLMDEEAVEGEVVLAKDFLARDLLVRRDVMSDLSGLLAREEDKYAMESGYSLGQVEDAAPEEKGRPNQCGIAPFPQCDT